MAGPVHYEVYVRKTAPAPWTLLIATEQRAHAMETAEETLRDKRAAAVRVTKETLDPDTMEFNSLTVMTRGVPEVVSKRPIRSDDNRPSCNGPADLYAPHARELLARVLEDWLNRNGVTAFELLHRPDLAERLEASGTEVQHAIQKVAVPESQNTGQPLHELIRHYQKLGSQAMERLIAAGRRDVFFDLEHRKLEDVANRLSGKGDRAFLMGGTICKALIGVRGARARLDRLMDLADQAPADGPPHALVMVEIEQLLGEMLTSRTSLAEVLGPALDQGGSLAAVVRMVAPREIDMLIRHDPRMALLMPVVDGAAERLGRRIEAGEFPILAASLARMVLRELMGPRRLRLSDAPGEIDILRALAMALTATAGRLLTLEEVQQAFSERSKSLVTADFVAAFVKDCDTVLCEAEQLTRLCENVTGGANKRSAARWLDACVTSLRFESEMRAPGLSASKKLAVLARLQKSVFASALGENDETKIAGAIGVVACAVEADAKLVVSIARASAPLHQKLAALLKLAAAEGTPRGPVTERARAEVLKLFRAPETRVSLAASPETLAPLKDLMKAVGLAA